MFFYTGITRISSHILETQKDKIKNNADLLDRLAQMVDIAVASLTGNNLCVIGEMLDESWQIKRQLSNGISNTEIDVYYEKAKKAGALGGKILGAGGGGFLMLYCEEDRQDAVTSALGGLKKVDVGFEPQGSKIIYVSE